MKLKAYINGATYDVVQGATFSEEYNETLDSGAIIIDDVAKITGLKPYDDVILYDADESGYYGYSIPGKEMYDTITLTYTSPDDYRRMASSGAGFIKYRIQPRVVNAMKMDYNDSYIIFSGGESAKVHYIKTSDTLYFTRNKIRVNFVKQSSGEYTIEYPRTSVIIETADEIISMMVNVDYEPPSEPHGFHKHMLIDQFTEKMVNVTMKRYKYSISLFSETKRLETIQLPNISITQPVSVAGKKSVYYYINRFVKEYTPKVKVSLLGDGTWDYYDKLAVSKTLADTFADIYAPDFSLTNPSLKDVLTQLMLTRDCIPCVKDGMIYAMDVTKRNGTFDFDESAITNVVGSMSSSNFADSLRRPYQNALSDRNSCHIIEFCGFRNSDNALLTIPNMRLETRYPIYRVNKIMLCYYKVGTVYNSDGKSAGKKAFICKQDITKLCMIDSARKILSQNWKEFEALEKGTDGAISIDDMAKYQMSTFSYSIGGNTITGWGDEYEHNKDFTGWFTTTSTVIENIAKQLDKSNPYGIYASGYISNLGEGQTFAAQSDNLEGMFSPFDNDSQKMKSFFFQVDYEAFYNGAVSISKDGGRDDVAMIDNSSSSLALLEKDGIFQKEKVNRFGNKALQINASYESVDKLQPLGSVYERDGDEDVIIYHREYSIYSNVVNAAYYGTKDYVLKNYWTTVYSQNRPFNLLPYEQSVNRAENQKVFVYLSKDELYYEGTNGISLTNFANGFIADAVSAFRPSEKATSKGVFATPNRLDSAFITCGLKKYQSDLNCFVAGHSICMNARMFDNASMGVHIEQMEPDYWASDADLQFIGSTQKWYKVVDDYGRLDTPTVEFGKFNAKNYYGDRISAKTYSDASLKVDYRSYYSKIFQQPLLLTESYFDAKVSADFGKPLKDNKETLDFTFQIEPLSGKDVAFSQWFMKLSDIVTVYNKVDEDYTVYDSDIAGKGATFTYASLNYYYYSGTAIWGHYPAIMLSMTKENFEALKTGMTGDGIAVNKAPVMIWNSDEDGGNGGYGNSVLYDRVGYYSFTPTKIIAASDESVTVRGIEFFRYKDAFWLWGSSEVSQETDIVLQAASKDNPVGHVTFDYDKNVVFSDTFPSLEDPSTEHPMPMMNSIKRMPNIRSRGFTTMFNIQVNPSLIGGSTGTQKLDDLNNNTSTLVVLGGETETTTYAKNMFLQLSNEYMEKEEVYEELREKPDGVSDSNLVSDALKCGVDSKKRPYVLAKLPSGSTAKSVRFWYYNAESSSYVFVFGANLTDAEIAAGECKIYASVLQTKDERVYDSCMKPIGTMRNCAKSGYDGTFGTVKEYE